MPSLALKPSAALDAEEVALVCGKLDAKHAGYAFRLIAHQLRYGRGAEEAEARGLLGLHGNRWKRVRTVLLGALALEEGRWTLPALAARQAAYGAFIARKRVAHKTAWQNRKQAAGARSSAPVAEAVALPAPVAALPKAPAAPALRDEQPKPAAARLRQGETGDLFAADPQARRRGPADDAAFPSLKKQTIEMGLALLIKAGRTESSARACLARLMQEWDDGYVAMAINATWKRQGEVADPYSRLRWHLKKYPTREQERQADAAGRAVAPAAARPQRPLATPKFLGLSDGFAQQIQERNRRLRTTRLIDQAPKTTRTLQ